MTSRGHDVIGRCAADAEKSGSAATRRCFYVMTTLDDDVTDCVIANDDVVDAEDRRERAGDRSPQTAVIRVSHRADAVPEGRDAASATAADDDSDDDGGDDDGERRRERDHILSLQLEVDTDDAKCDERLSVSNHSDSNDETLCLSDDDQTSPKRKVSQIVPFGQDGTVWGQETAAEKEPSIRNISRASADVTETEPVQGVARAAPENTEQSRVQPSVLSTSQQPIGDDDTGSGNRITFDRKLVDEIDAAMMAQNGYKSLLLRAEMSAKTRSKHSVVEQRLNPHGSAHGDHVTTPVNKSDPCRVEEMETDAAGAGNAGNRRRRKRLTAIEQRQQNSATSAAGS